MEFQHLVRHSSIRHFYLRDSAGCFGIPEGPNVTHLTIVEGGPFSTNLKSLGMFGNVGAVSLQILAHLKYRKVVLVGVDARYAQEPPDIQVEEVYDYIHDRSGAKDYIHREDNDPNHFSPAYYGKGRRENCPNVPKAIDGWERAAEGCSRLGLEVKNASPGSALTCFPHIEFDDALAWLESDS